jgi:hypothetical protein
MNTPGSVDPGLNRRGFFKTVSGGLTAAALLLSPQEQAKAQALAEKRKLERIASCTWPIRYIFKTVAARFRRTAPSGPNNPAATPGATADRGDPPPRAPTSGNAGLTSAQMKEIYGEITMLDFPQFTKDTFPGVTQMDIRSSLFGDVTDDSMYVQGTFESLQRLRTEVARQVRREDGRDRHAGPAHLEQRTDQSRLVG